jgi:hypothetical protein
MALAFRPLLSDSSMKLKYGSQALLVGQRPGSGTGAESGDTVLLETINFGAPGPGIRETPGDLKDYVWSTLFSAIKRRDLKARKSVLSASR